MASRRLLALALRVLLVSLLPGCSGNGRDGAPGASGPGQAGAGGVATGPGAPQGAGSAAPQASKDPREAEFARKRERMVVELASPASDAPITSKRVLDAMRAVPRHEFVPPEVREQSYENHPLPIPENQTISQPYIVALMTQLLDLQGPEKVLEVGTGSGYQAAILGELAAEVYTVEIRPQLLEGAKKTLEGLKARGVLHYKTLVPVVGDGSKGYAAGAPYDGIMVTAAPRKIPVELLNQLKPGGRLVIPVGDFVQELQLIRKGEDGSTREESIVPVRFVPLVGEAQGSAR